MELHDNKMRELAHLTLLSVENKLTSEQFGRLETLLLSGPEARKYYTLLIHIYLGLYDPECQSIISPESRPGEDGAFRKVISEDLEDTKIRQAILLAEAARYQIKPVEPQTPRRYRPTRAEWLRFLAYAAAIILFSVALLWLDRQVKDEQKRPVAVAVITDVLEAQWRDGVTDYQIGQKIYPGELVLERGYAKFIMNDGAEAVLEGPARFTLEAADRMELKQGRVFARVGPQSSGFTVQTPSMTVIDLGTEFGLTVDDAGTSQVHLIKGKAALIAGSQGSDRISQTIEAGQARQVKMGSNDIVAIQLDSGNFVRKVSGKAGKIWRGQPVSLADIVGGGNGFGMGTLESGILIDTGKLSDRPLKISGYGIQNKKDWSGFLHTSQLKAIDGIFVPDIGDGPAIVSSRGDIFSECPDTDSNWCAPVINTKKLQDVFDNPITINNEVNGVRDGNALFMHANIGITFDLNVIRSTLIDNRQILRRFTTLAVTPKNRIPSLIDVWILVDGKVRYSRTSISQLESVPIDILLNEQDRFLSLVVTDGVEKQEGMLPGNAYDWCYLYRPELVIE